MVGILTERVRKEDRNERIQTTQMLRFYGPSIYICSLDGKRQSADLSWAADILLR